MKKLPTFVLVLSLLQISIGALSKASNTGHISKRDAPAKGSTRIIGGVDAAPHAYPSIVAIHVNGWHACGGTIISEEWVLTAAHCLLRYTDPAVYFVTAGLHNRMVLDGSEQNVTVLSILPHPEYNKQTKIHDIGLIKVSPPFKLNENIKLAQTAPAGYEPKGKLIVAGWGVMNYTWDDVPDILHMVEVNIMDSGSCNDSYAALGVPILPSFICAGHEEGGKGACFGDSGGPLYDIVDGVQTELGIVSFGNTRCVTPGYPSVFTRLTDYGDWIQSNIAGTGSGSSSGGSLISRIKSTIAFSLCDEMDKYNETKAIQAPIKEDKYPDKPCGVFGFQRCGGEGCKPFEYTPCPPSWITYFCTNFKKYC